MPLLKDFLDRKVTEPYAIRLAGEYDIWDKRDSNVDLFQLGLHAIEEVPYESLLMQHQYLATEQVHEICDNGRLISGYREKIDAMFMGASFIVEWRGLKFLAYNGRGNSLTFKSRDLPETGHDALMMFFYSKGKFKVSLYHSAYDKSHDLSEIARSRGGGGHAGACGFQLDFLELRAILGNHLDTPTN